MRHILSTLSIVLLSSSAFAQVYPSPITVKELKRMDACQLEQLFARGQATALPVGETKGHVLLRTDAKLPRVRAKMSSAVWKGKTFDDDGEITNRWLGGFKAVSTQAVIGPSAYDGQPCIILEYAPGTAVFGNTRDEIREIAPGIFLGRFYERCPCVKLQGYFVLEVKPCGCKK
jgi:hypothetical protein